MNKIEKTSRMTLQQREAMLSFMKEHENFARGRVSNLSPEGVKVKARLLQNLADELNSLPNGATKSGDKWMKLYCLVARSMLLRCENSLRLVSPIYRSEDSLSALNSSQLSIAENKSARQVLDLEREALELRRELQDTRAKRDEADQKVLQLSNMLRRSEVSNSDPSEDGKTSVDSFSTTTTSSVATPRVIMSEPVTSL